MSDTTDKRPKTTFETLVNPHTEQAAGPRVPVLWIAIGVIALVAIAAGLAIALSGGDDGEEIVTADGEVVADPIETAEVIVDGDPLPVLTDPANDAAVGQPAPELNGLSYTGEPVEIFFDGRPKVVAFLAHWCPHCQEELPQMVEWLDAGGLRDDVDLYVVATAVTQQRPNFPPSAWFEREGLTGVPVMMDSNEGTAAEAFGLNAFPYWVVLDADGTVALRLSGQVPEMLGMEPAEAFSFLADFAVAE